MVIKFKFTKEAIDIALGYEHIFYDFYFGDKKIGLGIGDLVELECEIDKTINQFLNNRKNIVFNEDMYYKFYIYLNKIEIFKYDYYDGMKEKYLDTLEIENKNFIIELINLMISIEKEVYLNFKEKNKLTEEFLNYNKDQTKKYKTLLEEVKNHKYVEGDEK